jgi:16S rRNA (guanine527-N7)-methyltransferase
MAKLDKKNTKWETILKQEAKKEEIFLKKEEIELFKKYLFLIEEWNKKINITSIKNQEEVAIKHFIDSLLVLKHVPLSGRVADIGTGGGFPGIPLKIAEPSLEIFLIEPIRKRANFLRTVISNLNLKKITVFNGRAENFNEKEKFDFTISRALSNIKTFCELSLPLLKPGGYLVAMKGKETEKEIAALKSLEKKIKVIKNIRFELPQKSGARSIIVIQKCFT